ncbi:MAG TPA: pitrilysin family protein [Gemmatimonadaceae bacterium]|jgi:zinc protease|nr:pitrilysin family protein [Gemmatimonadaceae bacterium]
MSERKGVLRCCATLALLFVAIPPMRVDAQRAELAKIIQRKVLPNGLEVIVVENHGVPLATVEIDVKNGSFTQSPQYEGLAHMYEHMFFRADSTFPEPNQFWDRASDLGAVFNGTTAEERVNYYMTVPQEKLGDAIHLLAAALRAPLFRRDELERERQVVIGEYDRNESSPFFALSRQMDAKLYPGNFSRKDIIGDRQVILTTTPEKMRTIQKKYYVPNNSAVIVAGDVSPATVFSLVERELGQWSRGDDPFVADPIPPIPSLQTSDGVIVEAPVGAVTIQIQWQGPSVGQDPKSTYAADVFSDVLNDPQSQFQQRLVDSGLWQAVGVNYYTLNHTGPITISGQTSPEQLREALSALYGEIAKFDKPGYFTSEELEAVKAHRAVTSAFDRERASGFAHTLGFWWSVASLEYYMGYVDNMAQQTLDDLRAYARRYIVGKPHIAGVLIAPDARQSLKLVPAELIGGEAR